MSCTRFAHPARIALFAALLALIALGPALSPLSAQPGGRVQIQNVTRMESDDSIIVMAEIVLKGSGSLFVDGATIEFHVPYVGTLKFHPKASGGPSSFSEDFEFRTITDMPLFGTDGEPLTGKAMLERLSGSGSEARFKITIEIPNDPELRKDFSDPLLNPMPDDFPADDAGRIFGQVFGSFASSSGTTITSIPFDLPVFESLPEPADPDLFTDGFESGSTSAWTSDLDDGFNASGFFPDATDPGNGTSESLRSSALGVGAQNPAIPIADATASIAGQFDAIYVWDAETQSYLSFRTGAPAALNSLQELRPRQAVFINITDPEGALWAQGPALTEARDLPLVAGFNFEIWTGPDLTPIADAIDGVGDALVAVFMWDAETQSYQAFRTAGPAFTNNLEELVFGRAVWLLLSDGAVWAQPARDPVEG